MLPAGFVVLVGRLASRLPRAIDGGWSSADGRAVLVTLAAIAVVLVAQEVVGAIRDVVRWDLYHRYEEYLVARVMAATLSAPELDLFEDPDLAALADRAVQIARFEPGDLVDGLSTKWSVQAPGLAAIALVGSVWPLAAVALVAVWVVVGRQMQTDFRRINRENWAGALRRARYMSQLAGRPGWAKEVRVFGLVDWLSQRFGWHWGVILAEMGKARRTGQARMAALIAVALAVNAAVLAWAIHAAQAGSLGVAEATVLVQGLLAIVSLAAHDGDQLIEYGASRPPVVLELEQVIAQQTHHKEGTRSADALPRKEIRLENVRFAYPGRDQPVFTDLALRIEAGRSLGIVGVNGAGKTTLIKLLTGLERPQQGRITVDGIDLADLDLNSWRRAVAAIFQDFVHYELSARDNIAFGSVETADDVDDRLHSAVRRAGAESILAALPDGLDTPLSRRFEGGTDLSGGQWQRIALARALYAVQADARVLVLDEPTAQLDVRAEADLYDRFLELSRGLTTIVISHRFSTVRRADRIVVLDGGTITEAGSHEELLAADGTYARLFQKQAMRYVGGDDD